jgi:hypothetical protein
MSLMRPMTRRAGAWALVLLFCVLVAVRLGWCAAGPPAGERPVSPPLGGAGVPGGQARRSAPAPSARGEVGDPQPQDAPAPTAGAAAAAAEAVDTGSPLFDTSDTGLGAAFESLRPEVTDCYNAWIATDGKFEGRLELLFVIGQDTGDGPLADPPPGELWPVARVKTLRDELHHPMVELCVKNAISGLEFLPDEGEERLVVEVPFRFTSR